LFHENTISDLFVDDRRYVVARRVLHGLTSVDDSSWSCAEASDRLDRSERRNFAVRNDDNFWKKWLEQTAQMEARVDGAKNDGSGNVYVFADELT
jgi:hypothetical protein